MNRWVRWLNRWVRDRWVRGQFSLKVNRGRPVRHMLSHATLADRPGNSSMLDATSLATSELVTT